MVLFGQLAISEKSQWVSLGPTVFAFCGLLAIFVPEKARMAEFAAKKPQRALTTTCHFQLLQLPCAFRILFIISNHA